MAASQNVYAQDELESLHQLAVNHVKRRGGNDFGRHACKIFYRNKPPQYFAECRKKDNNIMRVYTKDHNGDQRSPINGRIKGLFFATGVNQETGWPTNWSHFGARRVSIPSRTMLTTSSNLYFADFYCKCDSRAHYVTLVLTKRGSEADCFCGVNLIRLDIAHNDFLCRSKEQGVRVTNKVWVEVFYTEHVDLSTLEIPMTRVQVRGHGSSKPGGLPKDRHCRLCNLNAVSDDDTERDDVDYDEGDFDYDVNDIDYDQDDVDFHENDVDYDGDNVDYNEYDIDYDVNDVDYDGDDIDYDVGDVENDVGDVINDVGDVENDVGYDGNDVGYDVNDIGYAGEDVDYDGHDVGYDGNDVDYDVNDIDFGGDYDIDDVTEQFESGWND